MEVTVSRPRKVAVMERRVWIVGGSGGGGVRRWPRG